MITQAQYLLATLLAYFGLLAGLIISLMAREELKDGRKYFLLLQNTIFVAVSLIVLYLNGFFWWVSFIVAALAIAAMYRWQRSNLALVAYPLFAFMLFFSRQSLNSFFLLSTLVFLYGLPTAALHVSFKKPLVRLFSYYSSFLLISVLIGLLVI